MNKEFIFVILVSIILCLTYSTGSFAQGSLSNMSEDLESLQRYARVFGKQSMTYNEHLLDLACAYQDTSFHAAYKDLALALIENNDVMRELYGVSSKSYGQAMTFLNQFYLLGRFIDSSYEDYHSLAVQVLSLLEIDLKEAKENKEEFLNILTYVNKFENRKDKAIRYAKQRLTLAQKNIEQDPTNYAYALTSYVDVVSQEKNVEKEIQKILNLENIAESDRDVIQQCLVLNLNPLSPKKLWLILMANYVKTKPSIESVFVPLVKLASANKIDLIHEIDSLCLNGINLRERINLYKLWGSYLAMADNWQSSLEYRLKAIDLALSNGFEDLTFYESRGRKVSEWENIAVNYANLNDYQNEIVATEKASDAIEKLCGKESNEWIENALNLSAQYSNWMADHSKSIRLLNDVLSVAIKFYGENNDTVVDIMSTLIGQYRLAHEYDLQIALCNKILEHPQIKDKGGIYNFLSMAYMEKSQWQKAMEACQKSIALANDEKSKRTYLSNKASLLLDTNHIYEAINLLDSLVDRLPKECDNKERFFSLNKLASAYSRVDKRKAYSIFENAEMFIDEKSLPNHVIIHYLNKSQAAPSYYLRTTTLERAIEAFKETNCQDSVLLGDVYCSRADMYVTAKSYLKAMEYYDKAVPCYKRLGYTDEKVLTLCNNVADNLKNLYDYDRAILFQKFVCDVRKETLGLSHPLYGTSLSNLFFLYLDADSLPQASKILEEYEDIAKIQGISQFTANWLHIKLSKKQGLYADAEKYYKLALSYAQTSEDKGILEREMAKVYLSMGDTAKYVQTETKSMEGIRNDIVTDFYQFTREERQSQLFYLENIMDALMADVRLSKQMVQPAFDFSLFSKGLLFHTETEIAKTLKAKGGKTEMFQQYLSVKSALEDATTRGDSIVVKEFQGKKQKLERGLANEFVSLKSLGRKLNITSKDVANKLGDHSLAIDFVRYQIGDTLQYGAFAFSNKLGKPIFIQLFTEETLKQKAFLSDTQVNYTFFKDASRDNFNLIWGKLLPYMEGYEKVYFSADGLLNKLAVEYLRDNDKTPIVEKYNLHRVFHLAEIKPEQSIGGSYALLGVHNHDKPTLQDKEEALRGGEWINLDNVIPEVTSIKNTLDNSTNGKVEICAIDDSVREEYVKSLSEQPITLLHIATHAFYYNNDELTYAVTKPQVDAPMAERALKADKTSLSGIVLRKGNEYRKLAEIPEKEDDILTSDEIENLSFPDLKLTVLSACQSGLGDVNGEGVWGLQRAFRIAGTQSLICTLDNVDDFWAQKFMEVFYQNAAEGKTIHESFMKARNYIYQENLSNPKVWSKFILIE